MTTATVRRQMTGSTAAWSRQREERALAMLLREGDRKRAAARFGVTPNTFALIVRDLYRELGVSGLLASALAAQRLGWLVLPEVAG